MVEPFGLGKRNERGKMFINFCKQQDLIVQEKENDAVHMEEPRRQETIPNRLHSGEATLQELV